jgi:hypothetical protein
MTKPLLILPLSFALMAVRAQPALPPLHDPLMSLMVSQPKIEIATQVVATSVFDPPVVRPGERSVLRVTFNALEESVDWPEHITVPPQLKLQPGAHGQNFRPSLGKLEPDTIFNSRVWAASVGKFTVPQFLVRVYGQDVTVPAAQLEVVESPPPGTPSGTPLVLQFAETNLYVGQATGVRVILPGTSGFPQFLNQVQLTGDGFIADPGAQRQRLDNVTRSFIYETSLTPIQAGKLSVFAQGFEFGGLRLGPGQNVSGPLPGPQFVLLESEPVELHAQPLPRQGELPGFTGAIGSLGVGRVSLTTNAARIGDPIKLVLQVTNNGEGTLARLVPPPPPAGNDWQVFADKSENVTSPNAATFHYTMIPLTEAKATPAIPFSYFDPKTARYVDVTIPPQPVTVRADGTAPDLSVLRPPGGMDEEEKQVALGELASGPGRRFSGLAPAQQQSWFVLVELGPIVAMVALWLWDRRRRYLEQHPGILLRRRARRALRRQWRALRLAASQGDGSGFATAAVNAMRVASAPHYPAEPQALVGSDVLQVLNVPAAPPGPGPRNEVVRRFFDVADAGRFGNKDTDAAALLPLQPELEQVLEELDERLCP